ncbi:hypothetical protein BDV96DRAFT_508731 [Lophiotrema nucula]|uniref:Heterokaryon incompatibility domain-containing protein n=1 Tax=Lophiotrema nucula TaxID=690887 RepID=A0A6A5YIB1_9PLEO|nr:hypothetical protein BDV96DRAFT_508731 [Lophiotrema nucula]
MNPRSKGRSQGLVVDENWIDLERLKTWMQCCDSEHGQTCKGFLGKAESQPLDSLLLIDVHRECLVEAPFTTRYFALSYVWGKDTGQKVLETRLDNVAQRPSRNDQGRNASPKLIEAMGAIYAHAYCTIVAAGGNDSHHGLRGIGTDSQPRSLPQHKLHFPAHNLDCLVQRNVSASERSSFWNKRGWTFQEKLMSRRCLIFAHDSVLWRCQRSIWREDMTADPDGYSRPELNQFAHAIFKSYAWPNLHQWDRSVVTYNGRNLSFESDRLAAIQGIEWALRKSFPGGFCYGLPEFFFDAALLWQPLEPVTRRLGDFGKGEGYLPSWSWAGWHGFLDGRMSHFGRDFVRTVEQGLAGRTTSTTISPLVEWWQVDQQGGRRGIGNEYAAWRDNLSETSEGLSPGWIIHFDHKEKKPHFTHPAANPATFWWPVPINAGTIDPQASKLPPHLIFKSARAFFVVDERLPNLYNCKCMAVSLRDSEGCWAGMLRLNMPQTATIPVGQTVELVAISKGYASNDADETIYLEEWSHTKRPRNGPLYEFVNVLWVRREEDWVLREALGRLEKGVWERQSSELMSFKLR